MFHRDPISHQGVKEKSMSKAVKPIPEGFHTVTPHLVIKGAAQAIEFYKRAFGAQVISRMDGPGGSIGHAELKIGDSIIFLADEFPGGPCQSPQTLGGTTTTLNLYVPDVDAMFKRAIAAGGRETMAVTNMFWGDRFGQLQDPYGHVWSVLTHVEDVSRDEMEKRAQAFWAQMQSQKKSA
jgi:PhnB protein